jgi:cyclopropane-fatty-acyl-phospholipid synthase
LTDRVKIGQRDYRHLGLAGEFDAVASVGMAEHVGRENLTEYFATVRRLLKPGGVFLNHAIGEGRREKRFHGPSFIDAHVFPDSDIPPLPLVLETAEAAGFEIRDVENLREHYDRTLRCWVQNLERHWDQAVSLVGERRARVWLLYMSGSVNGFEDAGLQLFQTLGVRLHDGGTSDMPPTRDAW